MDRKLASMVVALALVSWCQGARDAQRYLPVPSGDLLGEAHFKELLDTLLDDSIPPGQPEDLLITFRKLARQSAAPKRQQLFGQLVDLANGTSSECPRDLVQICLDVAGLTYEVAQDINALVKMGKVMNYIKKYGKERVSHCADKLEPQLPELVNRLSLEVEQQLDEFFEIILGLEGKAADEQLLESVRQFSISEDEIDDRRMLELASLRQMAGANSSREQLITYLDDRCQELERALEDVFNVFNLVRLFQMSSETTTKSQFFSTRFRKLNEYNRICIELSNDKSID